MSNRLDGAWTGPLALHALGFQAELARLGYSKWTARRHLQLLARLSQWLDEMGLEVAAVATQQVEQFFTARRDEGYVNLRTSLSVAPLVSYLRQVGAVREAPPPLVTDPMEVLLEQFRCYLRHERGLVEGTARFYLHVARLFLVERLAAEGLNLAGLTAVDVTGFVTRVCEHRSVSSSRQAVSALRSLLRFLRLEALTDLRLEQAVLSVAGWSPSLPRAVNVAEVQRLLAGCGRRTAVGRRDYAIVLLLARLGLRGGEVVALTLDDVAWRAGEIVVCGKGGRRDRLPLPADVGEALAAYLRRGRPASDSRRLFLRHCAPVRGLADTGALRSILARCCARAGLPYVSPHRLRHTAATQMLARGGSLAEIGQVLRHRDPAATAIYAKVDLQRLRGLARPWPGRAA
jgi:integrase/recombinase XerD